MRGAYAENLIHPADVAVFRSIESKFHDLRIDDCISCHVVAAAVQRAWPSLKLVHGRFMMHWEHSWLVTPSGNIIDAYPIAVLGGPILIDMNNGPWPLHMMAYNVTGDSYSVDPDALKAIVRQLT